MKTAIVLLSGGLDSSTALLWALKKQGWRCHSLAFDYGQRHDIELQAAARMSKHLGASSHQQIKIDLSAIASSALTRDIDVPKDRHIDQTDIPITYVPARNLIFLSLAAALAETMQAQYLVIGANSVDYSGYPDCRPEFLKSFEKTVNLGTKAGSEGQSFQIIAPLLQLGKHEIIELGQQLGLDYSLTYSCYDPIDGIACGHCDSCLLRQQGFAQLGQKDPIAYVS